VISRQAADTSAEQSQRTAGKADSETLAAADRLPCQTVESVSSLDLNRSVSPAVFSGSSLERSSLQHPVKLNGISNAGKSVDTCSGVYCCQHCSMHQSTASSVCVCEGGSTLGSCF